MKGKKVPQYQIPPRGSIDRKILDNYGEKVYLRTLKEREERGDWYEKGEYDPMAHNENVDDSDYDY